MRARWLLALALVAACSDPDPIAIDGGTVDADERIDASDDAGADADAGTGEDGGASEDAGAGADAGASEDAGAGDDAGAGEDGGASDAGPTDSGPADSGSTDSGPADAGPIDSGPIDSGPIDSGPTDSGPTDSGPIDPCSPLPSGLTTWARTDTASSGTPDTYFFDVNPGDPFCASITGGGGGSWSLVVSNGTSSGIYCSGSATCGITVPAGQTTLLVTAVTDDIGGYTLTVRYRPR